MGTELPQYASSAKQEQTYPSHVYASGNSRLHIGNYFESTTPPPTLQARLRSAASGALGGLLAGYFIPGLGFSDPLVGFLAGFASGYLLPHRQALQFPTSFVIALGLNTVFMALGLMQRAMRGEGMR